MADDTSLSADHVLAFLARDDPTDAAVDRSSEQAQAYREAASVIVAVQDPERLQPVGAPRAPGEVAKLLGPDLVPATGARFSGTVMLDPAVRAATLRELVSSGRVDEVLEANKAERTGSLQAHLERYLLHSPPPLETQSLAELDDTHQVAVWLEDVIEGVPSEQEVRQRAAYLRLLEPFETIAGDAVFRGRKKELDDLRAYIGVVRPASTVQRIRETIARWTEPDRRPAVSIYGPGGVGKSALVARFMLEHTRPRDDTRIPFAYLDFDRAALDVGDPVGLAQEMVRQLAIQFPGDDRLEQFAAGLARFASNPPDEPAERKIATARGVLADLLGTMDSVLGPRPYVVVLDTFEVVQYRGEARAFPLWDMLGSLQERWKFLRVVVSGRAPVETLRLAGKPPQLIPLADLDEESARAFLEAQGVQDPKLCAELVRAFGRIPLSLKLVASLASKDAAAGTELLADGQSLLAMSEELIQGQLYDRILDRVSNERVRRVAHPGLVLRRVNPEIILEVLNGPCGLGLTSLDDAREVFEELKREASLVSVDDVDGDLVHRSDLRHVMLKLLVASAPAQVDQIRRAAIDWYRRQPSRRAKAEELYHRLHLGEWVEDGEFADREVRGSVQSALVEFPPSVQRRLATIGFDVPPEILERATADERDAALAAQIEELLGYGPTSESTAWSMFQSVAADLMGPSPLFRAGARVAAQRDDPETTAALIDRGLEASIRAGSAPLTLGLLQERSWLQRRRSPEEREPGLRQLGEQAQRMFDRPAILQYRAQTVDPDDPEFARRVSALGGLLTQAEPEDVWGLVPALQVAVEAAANHGVRALLDPLRGLVLAQFSPFRYAVFADLVAQRTLEELQRTGPDASPKEFGFAFVRLAEVWPYRVLFVAPPYGRQGEQLTESAA